MDVSGEAILSTTHPAIAPPFFFLYFFYFILFIFFKFFKFFSSFFLSFLFFLLLLFLSFYSIGGADLSENHLETRKIHWGFSGGTVTDNLL